MHSPDDRAFVSAFPYALAALFAVIVLARFQPEAAYDIATWIGWLAGATATVLLSLPGNATAPSRRLPVAMALAGLSAVILTLAPAGRIGHLLWLVFSHVIGRTFAHFWRPQGGDEKPPLGEAVRWLLLAALIGVIMLPYATPRFVGGGDASVYAQTLADFLAQVRTHVFPVLAGQSEFAPNGEIHPLRTAPGFHYWGGVGNLLTWGALPPVGVMNLTIFLHGIAAAFSAYFSLRAFAPEHRWTSLLFAVLFVTSPGILAPLFGGDLIASWVTLPWLPPLVLGALRLAGEQAGPRELSLPTICLAALWLLHAAIAFWALVLLAPFGIAFVIRRKHGKALLGAAGLFLVLSVFVFASVMALMIPADPELHAAVRAGVIESNLRTAWSGFLRPVSPGGAALLSDQQLSAGLWLSLGLSLLALGRVRALPWRLLLAVSVGLVALLLPPIGGIAFRHLPDVVLNATEKWPSQRLFLLLSCTVPFLGLGALSAWRSARPKLARDFTLLLVLAAAWSTWECAKFLRRGLAVTHTIDISRRAFLPENLSLPRYSFEYFGSLPRYFSHGPASPLTQVRLLARDTLEVVVTNPAALKRNAVHPQQELTLRATNFGGQFEPALEIPPHAECLLSFTSRAPDLRGALQIAGKNLRQEFFLPRSGEERAFGLDPSSDPHVILSNPDAVPERVDLKFIRTGGSQPANDSIVAHVYVFQRAELPLRIESLVPFRVAVRSEQSAWLETPRLAVAGYRARVQGTAAHTATSPDGYVMVAVPAGDSVVELDYPGPWPVRLAFWLTALGWAGLCAAAFSQTVRDRWERHAPAIATVVIAATLAGLGAVYLTGLRVHSLPFGLHASGESAVSCELRLPVARPPGQVDLLADIVGAPRNGRLVFTTVDGKTGQIGFQTGDHRALFGPAFKVNYRAIQRLEFAWPSAADVPTVRWNEQLVLAPGLARSQ